MADPDRARDDPLRPLVWDGGRLYLQRYWSFELAVAGQIIGRSASAPDEADVPSPDARGSRPRHLFPPEEPESPISSALPPAGR